MKKHTAESLYEMMQPLSDHHRIHTRHCEMLRLYKVLLQVQVQVYQEKLRKYHILYFLNFS